MATPIELMEEADRRGILPPEKKSLLDEARRRGLVAGGEPQTAQLDFGRPVEEVRAEMAKIPEGPQRDALMNQWADAYVANERAAPKGPEMGRLAINPMLLADKVRNFARGTITGSVADELNAGTNAALHSVTGGNFGAPYDESIAYQEALDRALKKEGGSTVTEIAGALASGGALAKLVMGGAKTVAGMIPRGMAVGGTAAHTSAIGEGHGSLSERNDQALSGEGRLLGLPPVAQGMLLGAALPPGIAGVAAAGRSVHDAVSPTVARLGAIVSELPRKIGISASADGAIPGTRPDRAAAEQMIANALVREGVQPGEVSKRLDDIEDAATGLWTSGRAQNTTVLADVSPELRKLARQAVTRSPEGAKHAKHVIEGRQTGQTPLGSTAEDMASLGIPTRERLSLPIKGDEAKDRFGTHFGAGDDNVVPMGQGKTLIDGLRRLFQIHDEKFHGHAGTAARTEDAIIAAAKAEAQPAYQALHKAGQNIDISPATRPVIDKWVRIATDPIGNQPLPLRRLILRQINELFGARRALSNIEAFDNAKQLLDDRIGKLLESPRAPARRAAALLSEMKHDLLKGFKDDKGRVIGGVDNVAQGKLGEAYSATRAQFSSHMEAKRALLAGKEAAEKGGDEGARMFDAWRGNDGHEKLFRKGVVGHIEEKMGAQAYGADKSRVFDTDNMDTLIAHVAPRNLTPTGRLQKEYDAAGNLVPTAGAVRPEKTFGKLLDVEKAKIETRNIVQGGSQTDRNIEKGKEFDIMSRWEEIRQTASSMPMLAIKTASYAMEKLFGMRTETATAAVRMLFNADPAQRARAIRAIESRMGKNRMEQFTKLMEETSSLYVSSGARQSAMPDAEQ